MGGGAGRGMRLGGGGLDLSAGMGDSEMARYMRTQRMQMPGYRGASDDMMRAVMMDGGGRGGGPGEDGGFFSMSAGAGSFAPFARHPQNALGMSRGPERMGGGLWQSEQLQPGALESLGVGSPMRQGMFDTGVRDRGADLKPFDGRGDEDLMFLPARPPIEQLPQPQPQDTSVKKSADENRDSGESKPRVVRFADEEPARQPSTKPPPVPSTSAKTCSVCQHTEQGYVLYSYAHLLFLCLRHSTPTLSTSIMFRLHSRQILLPRYLMNGLSNLDETYREYSLAPTDDLIIDIQDQRNSKVNVTAGRRGGEGIQPPGRRWGAKSVFSFV